MISFSTLSHDEPYHFLDTTNVLRSNAYEFVQDFVAFPVREKVEISSINAFTYFCG